MSKPGLCPLRRWWSGAGAGSGGLGRSTEEPLGWSLGRIQEKQLGQHVLCAWLSSKR